MLLTDAIEEFKIDCKVRRLSERTIENYNKQHLYLARYLAAMFDVQLLEEVRAAHIKRFLLEKEEQGRKPHYVNDLLKAAKVFFKYCVDEGYLKSNPTAKIHNVKQPKVMIRTFNENEVLKMLNHFSGNDYFDLRDKAILAMFFDTGMRLNEVMTLRPEQIKEDYIIVWGKGSKERVVPLSPYLARLLMKYKIAKEMFFDEKNVTPQNYVFLSYRGKKMTAESIAKFMKKTAKAVGVRADVRVSPHTCRHTFAHLQLKNGLDIYSLSRLLEHENISITQRYLEGIRNDEILEAVKKTGILSNL